MTHCYGATVKEQPHKGQHVGLCSDFEGTKERLGRAAVLVVSEVRHHHPEGWQVFGSAIELTPGTGSRDKARAMLDGNCDMIAADDGTRFWLPENGGW